MGDRLALIALARDYGNKNMVYKGPEAKKAYEENGKVTLAFEPSSSALTAPDGTVKGFEFGYASGDTLLYVKANATIEGNKIIIWNDQVKNPVELRYAWLLTGEANVFNKDGLPAFPFRMKVERKD